MKLKAISSPTLQKIQNNESHRLIYQLTVEVEFYEDGDRHIDRKPNSFPEKPLTYLNCLELEALNEEYVQTMKQTPLTPEEREQRYQELLQEINDQLIIRWNNGGFLEPIVDDDE